MFAPVLSLGGIGLAAAVALGFAARKFAVEVDPREMALTEVLPGANCGACGFPGCGGYAKAVAAEETSPSQCTPGGQGTLEKVADIMGVAAVAADPQVAVVLCQGDNARAETKYRYLGVQGCNVAQKIADGPKQCPGGCLGLGTCARVCPFGAIEISAEGLAVIDREKCTGCTKCVSACPRSVLAMAPLDATVHVLCNSHDKGAAVRKYCQVGCIGCQICKKTAPEAYVIEDFLATVVYEHCDQAASAVEKCPTKCIRDLTLGDSEGNCQAPPAASVRPEAA